ncbi:hypothetical protein FB561_1672 [Kribbella amoyensis]|uniref:Uncharacterized protein n=1 Tax=Kribbella amoyensis TaxID=996641 RepID=A0A561BNY7_9ACTN|nr:hypothetical protein FB561_1672 [Kribbella amoyensis]
MYGGVSRGWSSTGGGDSGYCSSVSRIEPVSRETGASERTVGSVASRPAEAAIRRAEGARDSAGEPAEGMLSTGAVDAAGRSPVGPKSLPGTLSEAASFAGVGTSSPGTASIPEDDGDEDTDEGVTSNPDAVGDVNSGAGATEGSGSDCPPERSAPVGSGVSTGTGPGELDALGNSVSTGDDSAVDGELTPAADSGLSATTASDPPSTEVGAVDFGGTIGAGSVRTWVTDCGGSTGQPMAWDTWG